MPNAVRRRRPPSAEQRERETSGTPSKQSSNHIRPVTDPTKCPDGLVSSRKLEEGGQALQQKAHGPPNKGPARESFSLFCQPQVGVADVPCADQQTWCVSTQQRGGSTHSGGCCLGKQRRPLGPRRRACNTRRNPLSLIAAPRAPSRRCCTVISICSTRQRSWRSRSTSSSAWCSRPTPSSW